jgi:hypothetical protein
MEVASLLMLQARRLHYWLRIPQRYEGIGAAAEQLGKRIEGSLFPISPGGSLVRKLKKTIQ